MKAPSCQWCGDTGIWSGKLYRQDDDTCHELYNIPCPSKCVAGLAEAERRHVDGMQALFASAGLPNRYALAHLSDFHLSTQAQVKAALDSKRGLFITGPVGVGKTHLMAAIVRELAERGQPSLYITVPDLLAEIKSTYDHSQAERVTGKTEHTLVEGASKADWLALDDLGAEIPTDWVRTTLFMIVNDRYNWCRPLLATSNLSLDQLYDDGKRERLGARITSRLYEMCQVITMRGADRRERRQ